MTVDPLELANIEERLMSFICDLETKSTLDNLKIRALLRFREAVDSTDWKLKDKNENYITYGRFTTYSSIEMAKCEIFFEDAPMNILFKIMHDMEWERSHKVTDSLKLLDDKEEYREWYIRIKVPKPWWKRDTVFRRYDTYGTSYSQLIGFSTRRDDMPEQKGVVRANILSKLYYLMSVI